MSNVRNILIGEYIIALGFSSWAAIKTQQAPWPPTVVKTSLAFGILGIVALVTPELAATLGGGFLLAQLIKILNGGTPYTGGAPSDLAHGDGGRITGLPPKPADTQARTILSWKGN